jgi:hypothetical protein
LAAQARDWTAHTCAARTSERGQGHAGKSKRHSQATRHFFPGSSEDRVFDRKKEASAELHRIAVDTAFITSIDLYALAGYQPERCTGLANLAG